jgi:peptidyl-prolyl cis-trans isomerase D
MLRILRQGQKWIVGFVVIGVGFVFAFVFGSGGGTFDAPQGGPGIVLQVEERIYYTRDVQLRVDQITRSQRDALGAAFDGDAARDQIRDQAANILLRTTLLAREAERQGLSASQDEVRTIIRSIPGFVDANGAFNPGVQDNIERQYGTAARFETTIRDELLALKAQRLIRGMAHVTEAEARSALLYRLETAQLAIVRLDGEGASEDIEVPDEEVQALLAEAPDRIQQAYDDRLAEFDKPERIRARHILLRVPGSADDAAKAEIHSTLVAARARIEGGEDFAAVANEVSEDGSAAQGGDLGEVPRGRMVAAFEEAAFDLEVGVVSDVVETPFGLHLILVEEKLAPETISFQDAREQIAREEVTKEHATAAARTTGEEIAALIQGGGSLVDAARERELSILRPSPITRRPDGYVPELGFAPDVMDAAFARQSGADPTLHEVQDGQAFALIEVLARTTPSDEELAVQLEIERERMLEGRRYELEAIWLEARRKELDDAGLLTFDLSSLR